MRRILSLIVLLSTAFSLTGQVEISPQKDSVGLPIIDSSVMRFRQNLRVHPDSLLMGVVVIRICVSKDGDVISSEYIPEKSTLSDKAYIQTALDNAKKYTFNKAELDKQCGTISYKFSKE